MAVAAIDTLSDAGRLARFIGLPRWARMEDLDIVGHVERGLPARTLEVALKRIDPKGERLRPTDVIPKATYYRVKDHAFSREQSERVLWLARVLAETLRQYQDDADLALQFLTRRHPMLGGRTPYDLAKETVAGADLVLELLRQAEAGVAV